jgi:long-chain acyl-CoA synthetase
LTLLIIIKYTQDVEEILYAHPAVAEAAVVAKPDKFLGEEVMAYLTLKPGAKATTSLSPTAKPTSQNTNVQKISSFLTNCQRIPSGKFKRKSFDKGRPN